MKALFKSGIVLLAAFSIINFSANKSYAANVKFEPVSLIIGIADVNVDFDMSKSWTLGPNLLLWNLSFGGFEFSAIGAGARANFYFSGTTRESGMYLGPEIGYRKVTVKDDDPTFGNLEAENSYFYGSAIFGYQWAWKTFNMALGGGLVVSSIDKFELKDSSGTVRDSSSYQGGAYATFEYTLGWFF